MEAGDLDRLRSLAAACFAPCGILAAYAHGSRVSGRPRPDSDFDIGYYPLPGGRILTIREEMSLAARLSEAIGFGVDLRNLAEAPLELRGAVLGDGVRIYSSDEVLRVDLEAGELPPHARGTPRRVRGALVRAAWSTRRNSIAC